jgi:hypothetical protein
LPDAAGYKRKPSSSCFCSSEVQGPCFLSQKYYKSHIKHTLFKDTDSFFSIFSSLSLGTFGGSFVSTSGIGSEEEEEEELEELDEEGSFPFESEVL